MNTFESISPGTTFYLGGYLFRKDSDQRTATVLKAVNPDQAGEDTDVFETAFENGQTVFFGVSDTSEIKVVPVVLSDEECEAEVVKLANLSVEIERMNRAHRLTSETHSVDQEKKNREMVRKVREFNELHSTLVTQEPAIHLIKRYTVLANRNSNNEFYFTAELYEPADIRIGV